MTRAYFLDGGREDDQLEHGPEGLDELTGVWSQQELRFSLVLVHEVDQCLVQVEHDRVPELRRHRRQQTRWLPLSFVV